MSRITWSLNALIDDIRGTALLLAILLLCCAIGLAAFGIAKPQDNSGAVEFALVIAVCAAIFAALWAGLTLWRRARDKDR
jgi:ABC-type amino acid transport system permease subunit